MVYSDVTKNNWHLLLPKKEKYNKNDIKKILKLIKVDEKIARFIVLCTSVFYDSECTDYINNYNSINSKVKIIF